MIKRIPVSIIQIYIIALFLISCTISDAQIINNESFDNTTFLPAGWSSVGTTTLWSRRTTGTFPTCTPQSGAGMSRFSSRAQTAGTNQTIATPIIDYSARASSSAYISFFIYRDNGSVNGDSISVYINTSASLSGAEVFGVVARYSKLSIPDTVAINGWYKYSFNVPSKYTGASNYIMIKGTSQNGNNIYIDDVQWNSYPNLCTGKPTPGTAIASPALICGGSGSTTINLNGQTTGVTGLAYQWKKSSTSSGPWTTTGTGTTTLLTGTITTTQYYKCIVSCMNSAQSDSTPVLSVIVKSTPNPVITVIPANANYCAGGKGVKLLASGGIIYSWSPALGLNTTSGDSVLASPGLTTTYTVRGTDTAGCSAQATAIVNLRQPPFIAISSPDSVTCQGDSILLTAQSGGGGNTYLWTPSGKTTNTIFAAASVNTKYTLTATNGFGCKASAFKNIYFSQKPKANFGANITGRTYTFSDSSLNAKNVVWDFGDGNSSTSKNPVYTYSFDGTKTVQMVVYNPPCASDTFMRTFNVSKLKNSQLNYGFKVFPNPATDLVNIHFTDLIVTDPIIILMDITGKRIQPEFIVKDSKSIQMNTQSLNSGTWFFEIIYGNEIKKGTFSILR